jgi:hypothetical protein
MRCVDLSYPLNGGTMVVSFCFERTALAYAREIGLATYKISVKGHVIYWA